jgi:hypothetical protein
MYKLYTTYARMVDQEKRWRATVATSYSVHNIIEPSTRYCFFLNDIDSVDSSRKPIKLRT